MLSNGFSQIVGDVGDVTLTIKVSITIVVAATLSSTTAIEETSTTSFNDTISNSTAAASSGPQKFTFPWWAIVIPLMLLLLTICFLKFGIDWYLIIRNILQNDSFLIWILTVITAIMHYFIMENPTAPHTVENEIRSPTPSTDDDVWVTVETVRDTKYKDRVQSPGYSQKSSTTEEVESIPLDTQPTVRIAIPSKGQHRTPSNVTDVKQSVSSSTSMQSATDDDPLILGGTWNPFNLL